MYHRTSQRPDFVKGHAVVRTKGEEAREKREKKKEKKKKKRKQKNPKRKQETKSLGYQEEVLYH